MDSTTSTQPAPEVVHLGTIGTLSCDIATTHEPWRLDIDAIVVSVGTGLGRLAQSVTEQFPQVPWKSVRLREITPSRPHLLPLTLPNSSISRLRLVVLASPHQGGGHGSVTLSSVASATVAAIEAAAGAGTVAIGLPLLATGVLGLPADEVAVAVLRAVAVAADRFRADSLRRLVFVTPNGATASAVQRSWNSEARGARDEQPDSASGAESPPFSDTELAGGIDNDHVPCDGIPLSKDRLELGPYVSMLATVIADRATPLPLSIGIFGSWGSGKSYFMGLLRHQVNELAKANRPTYCARVEQISFNAWHYAYSNLWASLGDEIFRQLAGQDSTVDERREKLRTELRSRLHERKRLDEVTAQASMEVAVLQATVDEAVASRESKAHDLIVMLQDSKAFGRLVRTLWRRLGVSDDVEQRHLLSEQLHGTLSEAEALRRSPWNRRGWIALAVAALLFVAGALAVASIPAVRDLAGLLGGLVTVVATAGATALARARSGLRKIQELSEHLRNSEQPPDGDHQRDGEQPRDTVLSAVAAKVAEVRQAEARQRVAQAQLDEVVLRVGELGRELAELSPGRRLYTFLAERANGDSYRANLGLISVIRKDFEELVALMKESREEEGKKDGTAKPPVERIVLYIDDLDRCEPRQVVDVLQAVHLLLALELFVVVVGVDPRWLVRSLCSHFDEILQGESEASRADGWSVTPEDYLEKILNIPLVLPGMAEGNLARLLRSMVEAEPLATDTEQETLELQDDLVEPSQTTVEKGSEADAIQRPTAVTMIPRPLTEPEIDLLTALDPLVDTPREAKRLFNLYRMVRSTRKLADGSRFLGDATQPGDHQAVVVLLGLLTAHARLLGQVLDTPPDMHAGIAGGLVHRPPSTPWQTFVEDFKPRRGDGRWTNRLVGPVLDADLAHWNRMYMGLLRVSAMVTLPDVSSFQDWVPRIRRFSYVLSAHSGSELVGVRAGEGREVA